MAKRVSLKHAVRFHGHLGPYLVLGLLAGEYGLAKIKANPYFAAELKVWGALKRPKSCIIDGLQLSTGCTYGKGNIKKYAGTVIKIFFRNLKDGRDISLGLKPQTIESLKSADNHLSAEKLARQFYRMKAGSLFKVDG